jgi:hypothetical protein
VRKRESARIRARNAAGSRVYDAYHRKTQLSLISCLA